MGSCQSNGVWPFDWPASFDFVALYKFTSYSTGRKKSSWCCCHGCKIELVIFSHRLKMFMYICCEVGYINIEVNRQYSHHGNV